MTFDDAVKNHQGEWSEDGQFRFVGSDGYIWIGAKKEGSNVVVTKDGVRFGLSIAKEPTPVVESVGKKQRKKEEVPPVVAPPKSVVTPQTVDELEI